MPHEVRSQDSHRTPSGDLSLSLWIQPDGCLEPKPIAKRPLTFIQPSNDGRIASQRFGEALGLDELFEIGIVADGAFLLFLIF